LGENYNIGGHNEWANIDIVKLVCGLVEEIFAKDKSLAVKYSAATAVISGEAESLITYVEDRLGHDRRYAIDATKSTRELGYKPIETFESGIRKTVRWYLENDAWWAAIMDGSYREWAEKQYT
jgi:dTDP-glucose 4,6-dehydratase (EC 4.2.1.46)